MSTALQAAEPINTTARLFSLNEVRLTDPELLKIRKLEQRYLLSLDNDRLLRNYLEIASIRTGLPELSGLLVPGLPSPSWVIRTWQFKSSKRRSPPWANKIRPTPAAASGPPRPPTR